MATTNDPQVVEKKQEVVVERPDRSTTTTVRTWFTPINIIGAVVALLILINGLQDVIGDRDFSMSLPRVGAEDVPTLPYFISKFVLTWYGIPLTIAFVLMIWHGIPFIKGGRGRYAAYGTGVVIAALTLVAIYDFGLNALYSENIERAEQIRETIGDSVRNTVEGAVVRNAENSVDWKSFWAHVLLYVILAGGAAFILMHTIGRVVGGVVAMLIFLVLIINLLNDEFPELIGSVPVVKWMIIDPQATTTVTRQQAEDAKYTYDEVFYVNTGEKHYSLQPGESVRTWQQIIENPKRSLCVNLRIAGTNEYLRPGNEMIKSVLLGNAYHEGTPFAVYSNRAKVPINVALEPTEKMAECHWL